MAKLATLEDFEKASKRRFKEVPIEGFGNVRLRSLTTAEYQKIESLTVRAATMLREGKKRAEGERLLKTAKFKLIGECLVDAEGNTLGIPDAKLEAMDAAIAGAIESACLEHTGVEGLGQAAEVDEAAKN